MSCDPVSGWPDKEPNLSSSSRRFKHKGVEYKWKASDQIKNNLYVRISMALLTGFKV